MRLALMLLFLPTLLVAQSWKSYRFSDELQAEFAEDSSASTAYQFIQEALNLGKYEEALKWYDIVYPYSFLTPYQDSVLSSFDRVPAKDTLLTRTQQFPVVLFSDAVHTVNQRAFLTTLLSDLKHQGFTCLALPDLKKDTLFTTLSDSLGTFLREKEYRELVTTALDLDFRLLSLYDSTALTYHDKINAESRLMFDFLQANPSEKVISLVDPIHFQEEPKDSTLETITYKLCNAEIYPFTVHQTLVTERATKDFQVSFLDSVQEPVYLLKDSVEFRTWSKTDIANMVLVLPPYVEQESQALNQKNFTLPAKRFIEYPVILAVYSKENYEKDSYPLYLRELVSEEDNTSFALSKGEYIILFIYRDRELYHTLNVIITK